MQFTDTPTGSAQKLLTQEVCAVVSLEPLPMLCLLHATARPSTCTEPTNVKATVNKGQNWDVNPEHGRKATLYPHEGERPSQP